MILWQCELCGKTAYKRHEGVNMRCMCATVPKPTPKKVCLHRGPSAGKASCGCGTIYHCSFTGGYCGDRDVVEFATIGEDTLTRENYRRCATCASFLVASESQ